MVLIKIPPLDEIKNDDFSEVYLSYNQCTACGNKQLKKKKKCVSLYFSQYSVMVSNLQ